MLSYTHLLLLLQPSVLRLSIVTFNDDAKPPSKWILREFDVSRIGPRLGGLPHLERLHGKIWPRLRGLPGLADRATRLGGSPHLSCKRDQIKMRDYMDRRATSPPWGPPPPCKQALIHYVLTSLTPSTRAYSLWNSRNYLWMTMTMKMLRVKQNIMSPKHHINRCKQRNWTLKTC